MEREQVASTTEISGELEMSSLQKAETVITMILFAYSCNGEGEPPSSEEETLFQILKKFSSSGKNISLFIQFSCVRLSSHWSANERFSINAVPVANTHPEGSCLLSDRLQSETSTDLSTLVYRVM